MQEKTQHYYQQKAETVLQYIQNNLGADLSLNELSNYSDISSFHFHRIMKAILGEPLGVYINRKRLEAATTLIRYSNETLNEIAPKVGYNDVSAFSKAFSKEFGISPQAFKKNPGITLNTHVDFCVSKSQELTSDIKPKLIVVPDKTAICVTVKGIYGGEETYQAWEELTSFVMNNKLVSWNPEAFSVYYNDPETTPAEDCISDICFVTKKKFVPQGRIYEKTIIGGKYAVFRYKGSYERLWELYTMIYTNWLLYCNFQLRNLPVIEKYRNFLNENESEDHLIEIYIPVV